MVHVMRSLVQLVHFLWENMFNISPPNKDSIDLPKGKSLDSMKKLQKKQRYQLCTTIISTIRIVEPLTPQILWIFSLIHIWSFAFSFYCQNIPELFRLAWLNFNNWWNPCVWLKSLSLLTIDPPMFDGWIAICILISTTYVWNSSRQFRWLNLHSFLLSPWSACWNSLKFLCFHD